jgi:uncharacterized protein GlcG (DUF336 family)
MAITLEEANCILQGAIAKAEKLGIKINVAVCRGGTSDEDEDCARAGVARL